MRSLRMFFWDDEDFLAAAKKGNLARISDYLDKNPTEINVRDDTFATPLMLAAEEGHLLVVRELLKRNAAFDIFDEDHCTALMKASDSGHLDVVEELLVWEANSLLRDKEGKTALILTIRSNPPNSFSICKQLIINSPAVVNLGDDYNCTPLLWAADINKPEIMEFLLEHKADIDHQNSRGETALFIAAHQNHLAAVQFLLERGADTTIPDEKGRLAEEVTQTTDIANLIKAKRPITLAERLRAIPEFDADTIPKHLLCPLTLEIMTKPITIPGTIHTYERAALENWFRINHTNPMTNLPVPQVKEKHDFPINQTCALQARLFVETIEEEYAAIVALKKKQNKAMYDARERRFFPSAQQNVPTLSIETVASEEASDAVKSTNVTINNTSISP